MSIGFQPGKHQLCSQETCKRMRSSSKPCPDRTRVGLVRDWQCASEEVVGLNPTEPMSLCTLCLAKQFLSTCMSFTHLLPKHEPRRRPELWSSCGHRMLNDMQNSPPNRASSSSSFALPFVSNPKPPTKTGNGLVAAGIASVGERYFPEIRFETCEEKAESGEPGRSTGGWKTGSIGKLK